jgi:hypothetical protein
MKVYLSSTFKDLEDHRRYADRAMRSLGLDVVAMEDYVARDERPVERCLADVEAADLYVGVFGFRYGLRDGDFVVVDPSQEERAGDIVVVLVGNQDDVKSLVKRLWYEGTTIRLESSNPDYPPVTLGPDDHPQIASKVTGIFRPVERTS